MSDANNLSVSPDSAAETRPGACLAHAAPLMSASLRRLGLGVRDEVAVLGLGPQSQLGLALAKALGAQVTVLSPLAGQRAEARRLGADAFITLHGPEAFAHHAGRFRAIFTAETDPRHAAAYAGLLQPDGLMLRLGAAELALPAA